jgi:hypothetical protein
MYKLSSDWLQRGPRESTANQYGIDPTTWSMPTSYDDVVIELGNLRAKMTEINAEINLSKQRYNGRIKGNPLPQSAYGQLLQHKTEIGRCIAKLEARCALERNERREAAKREEIVREETKLSLAGIFMDMAKAMLADDVYKRVLVAAVHRYQDKIEETIKDGPGAWRHGQR